MAEDRRPVAAPSFQFYVGDFLRDTQFMTAAAVGAHVRLLVASWTHGALPDNPAALARAMNHGAGDPAFDGLWDEVSRLWSRTPTGLVNEAIELIRERQKQYREVQAAKGRLGAAAKHGTGHSRGSGTGQSAGHNIGSGTGGGGSVALHLRSSSSDLRSSNSLSEDTRRSARQSCAPERAVPDGFDEFWRAYPRRDAKQDAIKAWRLLNPNDETRKGMLAALDWQRCQPGWRKDGGRFIPLAATWIRGRRWEDEPLQPLSDDDQLDRVLGGNGRLL